MLYKFVKIVFVLCLCLAIQERARAQSFMVEALASSKVARLSLAEGIAQKDRLLLDLVTKAGLMPVLSNSEEHTFFAPSEQALALHQNASPEQLRSFFEKHIVKGNLASDNLKDGATLKTLSGDNLRICRKKGAVLVSGVRLTQPDQLYANGVVHHLNGSF